mmetsp:Transcript_13864/g.33543  ORF Transcript_13864/g.33543 Transcript_13864/m.33543 type:complete len:997 (+) Transcript_13864:139-3129(+)
MRSLPASEAVLRNMKIAETARVKDGHSNSTGGTLEAEIAILRRQLLQATVENSRKDTVIESLEKRIQGANEGNLNGKHRLSPMGRNGSFKAKKSQSLWNLSHSTGPHNSFLLGEEEGKKDTDSIVSEIQGWLFMEGGKLRDVDSLLTRYCELCRKHGIPLDRLFVAGMMMHPHTSACVWKWELGCNFTEDVVPPEAFEPQNFDEDEPFAVLMQGKAMKYRMNADGEIPAGCDWFKDGGYQDYYALPMYHNGKFKGAMAWSTKSRCHFSDEHQIIFTQSLGALSTVLRLYANDLVIDNAMLRLEEAVQAQTNMLAEANAELELANRKIVDQAQKQLKHFAMMSHEIRTPLNCIVGISNLMLDSCEEESMRESIEMITSSGDLLLAVVDDVLDYSKLAAGKVETKIAPTKLRVPINTVETSIRTKAIENGLELRTNYSPDLPEFVVTDARRLQQILYNLLGNAAKFGSTGKYVDFSIVLEPRDRSFLRFSIKDYGKGIAPEELNNIFEPFRQLASNQPSHGGTGLGLAITRQLVRALGGTVEVQSDYGNWCEFTVCLPCDSGNLRPMGASSVPNTLAQDSSVSEDHSDNFEGVYESDEEEEEESVTSMDSSCGSYGGLSSTTSFQELVHEAARRQAKSMGGDMRNHQMNPLAPTAVASLHKLRTQLLSSSSLKSGSTGTGSSNTSSIGFGSNASSIGYNTNRQGSNTSMRNVQFQQFKSPKSNLGLAGFSGRTGSFGQLGNALGRSSGSSRGNLRSRSDTARTRPNRSASLNLRKRSAIGRLPRRGSGITGGTISLPTNGGRSSIIPEEQHNKAPMAIPEKNPVVEKIRTGEDEMKTDNGSSKPAAKAKETKETASEQQQQPENTMAFIKVLVAEDNKINQKVLKRTLIRVGIEEIDIVENGKLAVEASDDKVYDIIFMDMQMPIMDGLEATSIISRRPIHPKIVFLTAHALSEYQEKAIEAGGDCFISKPFKLEAIRGIIEKLVLSSDEEEESEEEI